MLVLGGAKVVTIIFEFPSEILSFLCRKFAGNRIVQTQLMSDLLVGVRVAMTLVQKVQGPQGSLWNDSSSPIWQSMCGLLSIFTKFLNDSKCISVQNDAYNCMPVSVCSYM